MQNGSEQTIAERERATASPFVRKLRHGAPLTERDEAVLAGLARRVDSLERGDIMHEGEQPRSIALVLSGWACRYKQLPNGKRQITAVLIPGDLCEPFGAVPPLMDHTLSALTLIRLGRLPPEVVRSTTDANPRIYQALWWDLLLCDALAREHMVSLGRRSASERLGHFFCEMHFRLSLVDLVDGDAFDVPLTQSELADLLGLSAVHVNRSLQELRAGGLMSLRGRRVVLHDEAGLRRMSMFEPPEQLSRRVR